VLSPENVFGCGKYKTVGRKVALRQEWQDFVPVATPLSPILYRNLILGEIFMFLAPSSVTEMLMKFIFCCSVKDFQ